MAVWPPTVAAYVYLSLVYAFVLGLAYSAFTAFVLYTMGHGSGATKYNVFPLDDRKAERVNSDLAGRPQVVHGSTQLLFSGMRRLSENSVINAKNKSHAITAEVVRKARMLFWMAVGVVLLLARGLNLRTVTAEAERAQAAALGEKARTDAVTET